MEPSELYYPMNIIAEGIEKVKSGIKRVEIKDSKYHIKVYSISSHSKYADIAIRVDIQDLELMDY